MHLFSQKTFHQLFSRPVGKEKETSFSFLSVIHDKELNDNKAIQYEDISQEDLSMEHLEDVFFPHIPPFNFEQENESLYTLTILLPGVQKNNVHIFLKKNKAFIQVKPSNKKYFKENAPKIFHQGIFDILMPSIPFESIFEIPKAFSLKEYNLAQGILTVTFEKHLLS